MIEYAILATAIHFIFNLDDYFAGITARKINEFKGLLTKEIAYPKRHKEQFAAIHRGFSSAELDGSEKRGLPAGLFLGPGCAVPAPGQAISKMGKSESY